MTNRYDRVQKGLPIALEVQGLPLRADTALASAEAAEVLRRLRGKPP
jgi:hypothetical protein